jgi:hypothetical protein
LTSLVLGALDRAVIGRNDFDVDQHRCLHSVLALNKSSSMRRIGDEIQGTQHEKARPLAEAGLSVCGRRIA